MANTGCLEKETQDGPVLRGEESKCPGWWGRHVVEDGRDLAQLEAIKEAGRPGPRT